MINKIEMKKLSNEKFNTIVLGIACKEFKALDLENLKESNAVVYDVKGILNNCDCRL